MNCVRCGRPINLAARVIQSKQGPLAWGPVCARKAGLIEHRPRLAKPQEQVGPGIPDPTQMKLELTE